MVAIKSSFDFSTKYDEVFATRYYKAREDQLSRRINSRWEIYMARKSLKLAGNPISILDLPCGTGRFWPMLVERPDRILLAADSSQAMIDGALAVQLPEVAGRFKCLQTDAMDINLLDNVVENVFCMRLIHHINKPEDRMRIYRELARVASDSICVSLRVEGNFKAWHRKKKKGHKLTDNPNRNVLHAGLVEDEFSLCGLEIIGKIDLLPYYSMWRTYVLKVV